MVEYEVIPGVGIGSVRLGMTRSEVLKVMGSNPHTFRKGSNAKVDTDAYHHNSFQVFYSEEDEPKVDYIELSRGSDFVAIYQGIDVFNTKAVDLVPFIEQDAPFDETDFQLGYSYIFPKLDLSVWRPILPESDDPDEPYEEEFNYFSTIGVEIPGTYSTKD